MKKDKTLIITVVMLMATLSALPSLALNNNSVSHVISYSGAPVIGTDTLGGVTYSTVTYSDLYNGGEPGMPSLPIDYIRFSVPYNATNFTVTATVNRWSNQYLDHLLYPCQRPRYGDGSDSLTITLPDSSAYYSGEYYPSQQAWVTDEGYLAGENHIVTVAVMPFRYSHTSTSDILSRAIRCNLTLRFDLSDNLSMYPIVRNDSLLREEGYELAQSMVVNPNQVKSFAPSSSFSSGIDPIGGIIQEGIGGNILNGGGGGNTPQPQDSIPTPVGPGDFGEEELLVDGGNYTYLIVTTSDLKHSMRRLAALKRQKGYNVKVVTMNDVISSPLSGSGDVIGEGANAQLTYTDNAGKLRQYIRNYYKYYGTKYVLLAGKDIPYRMYTNNFFPDGHGDLYYSELNGNWQISSDEELERMPEVYVGRLLFTTQDDVNNYTNKLMRYELNPGNGDVSYLRRALFTEGRDYPHSLDEIRGKVNSYFPNQVVMRDSVENGDYPKGCDIIDTINTHQFGFISSINHGSPAGIKTYGTDSVTHKKYFLWAIDTVNIQSGYRDTLEINNGLNRILNSNYPMVYYSLACQTMPYFQVSGNNVDINFGESFTLGSNYGGPAYLGYTTTAFKEPSIGLFLSFINQIKTHMRYQLGPAEAYSKPYYNGGDFVYVSVYHNLLGDPSMELWTNTPNNYQNVNISRTDSIVTISCAIGTILYNVAYCSNDGQSGVRRFYTSQCSISDISPNSTIMLYKHNQIPYIAPLLLQNTTMSKSQYVIAGDVTAGHSVDNLRKNGDVTVKCGVEYEIEAAGNVRLEDGFKVEKGAMFAVYPAEY